MSTRRATSSARGSGGDAIRAIALIDGEHHPPVVRDALERLTPEHDIAAVLFAGGEEKVGSAVRERPAEHYGREVVFPSGSLDQALRDTASGADAQAVIDLSGDPVLDGDARLRLAAVALDLDLEYRAPGLRLTPPPQERVPGAPVVSLIGTGKRVGKTAVGGHLAALLRDHGERPVVVSMGRGGPQEPVAMPAGEAPDLDSLLALAREGRHASSDYLEDAVLAGVATVGCRRCAEGPAGEVFDSNVVAGVRLAMTLDPSLVVIEGSGSSIPPVRADRTVCVVAAAGAHRHALGNLGPLRLLRSELLILIGADALGAGERRVLVAELGAWCPRGSVVAAHLVPEPAGPVAPGARVAVFTTAPEDAIEGFRSALAEQDIDVAMVSGNLARRGALVDDLAAAKQAGCGVYLTELKAAAVDMVAEHARGVGAEVVFLRHRPRSLPGEASLDDALLAVCAEAATVSA